MPIIIKLIMKKRWKKSAYHEKWGYLWDGEELISTTDLKGTFTSYNDTFLKISGYTAEELEGIINV